MKRMIAALVLTSALVSPVNAADIFGDRDSLKDGGGSAAVVNWSGFYLGGQVGYGKAQHDVEVREYDPGAVTACSGANSAVNANATGCTNNGTITAREAVLDDVLGLDGIGGDGFIGGGRVGFDIARGRLLFGVFADYNFSNIESTLSASSGNQSATFTLEKENEWTVGARIGAIVAPRTLVYILGGYTESDYKLSGPGVVASASFNPEHTISGFTGGAGVEYAAGGGLFLGLEGLYTAYDTEEWFDDRTALGNGTVVDVDTDELKALVTAKYKFGGGLNPLD